MLAFVILPIAKALTRWTPSHSLVCAHRCQSERGHQLESLILVALRLTDIDRMAEPMASVLEMVECENVVGFSEIWSGGLPILEPEIDQPRFASNAEPKPATA